MGAKESAFKGRNQSPLEVNYTMEERGKPNSFNYRMYLRSAQGPVSPFHDVPLYADMDGSLVNMVVEMPRWSNAKMEINTREPLNPIMQDSTRGRMRYLANVFPYHGVPWNYGALPQTWENPHLVDGITGCLGDNDPVDVIEIGDRVAARGDVRKVKVLGALALIDQGESDWKMITVDTTDRLATMVNDIADVELQCPGLLNVTVDWFRVYKVPDGKPENNFAFEGKPKGRMLAMRIIADMHRNWGDIVKKRSRSGGLVLTNSSPEHSTVVCGRQLRGSPYRVSYRDAEEIVSRHAVLAAPRPIPSYVDNWFFLSNRHQDVNIKKPPRIDPPMGRKTKG